MAATHELQQTAAAKGCGFPMSARIERRYAPLAKGAEYASCNEKTLRRAIADGEITGYRLKRDYRVDLNEIDRWLEHGAIAYRPTDKGAA